MAFTAAAAGGASCGGAIGIMRNRLSAWREPVRFTAVNRFLGSADLVPWLLCWNAPAALPAQQARQSVRRLPAALLLREGGAALGA